MPINRFHPSLAGTPGPPTFLKPDLKRGLLEPAFVVRKGYNHAFWNESMAVDDHLDVCGLSCPLPLLKAKQALNRLESGQVLSVVCTDPGSVRDFQVFSDQSGHQLLVSKEDAGNYYYELKKT